MARSCGAGRFAKRRGKQIQVRRWLTPPFGACDNISTRAVYAQAPPAAASLRFTANPGSMRRSSGHEKLDVPFAVPCTHRLRFTGDVLGDDQQTLADLLEPSEGRAAKVQFWLDDFVAQAQPDLKQRIVQFMANYKGRVTQAGNVQLVAGGEAIKNDIHVLERMLKVFNHHDLDRRSYVVVIGGGAVLDAVGFAVQIAHRGLRLVRLPTTTLAQADSGIGVKSGVNLFGKKNWLGAFGVPWGVVNDAALLSTLSDRDFRCGFAEAVKVALLKDPQLLTQLHEQASRIARREMSAALPIIRASAVWHLKHITQGGDPFEMLEARPLDYGHWSAHKLEALSDYTLRHGEAVAIGVAIDTVYSSLVHGLHAADADRVLDCLTDLGFALDHPLLADPQTLFAGMEEFRQHLGGRLTLTMLRGVGDPIDVHEVDDAKLREAIQAVRKRARRTSPAAGGDRCDRSPTR
ncbi:MAG: 3-dehydroquinate synthase [Planctomycetales bacterium]|nr:3-dehydroquinate synthase [Planctomycetales bacterium]